MKVTSSYAVEMKHSKKIFRDTIKIYQDAISFCVKALEEHWEVLESLETGKKERFAYTDALLHSTKSNQAAYPEFDSQIGYSQSASLLAHNLIAASQLVSRGLYPD